MEKMSPARSRANGKAADGVDTLTISGLARKLTQPHAQCAVSLSGAFAAFETGRR